MRKMKKILKQLLEYKNTYPNVPVIYNRLAIVYYLLNDNDNRYQTIQETVQKFPDYLFGKIALAEYYLYHDMMNKIPKALDNKFEIFYHYPGQDVFHFSEVQAFYSIVGQYYVYKKKIEQALLCYFLLSDLGPNHPATKLLGDKIIFSEIENTYKGIKNQ